MDVDAEPDPFGDLEGVLAALPRDTRQIALHTTDRDELYVTARSWALTKHNMTGRDEEVRLFIELLSSEIPEDDSREVTGLRNVALYAIKKAVLSGKHSSRHSEFRDIAMEYLRHPAYMDHAAGILYLLREQAPLDSEAEEALERAMRDPRIVGNFDGRLQQQRSDFESGRP